MTTQNFPALDPDSFGATHDALHAYSRLLGDWLKTCRPRCKHWWHASLRPSLYGLTTGVVCTGIDFELALNLRESQLVATTAIGEKLVEPLRGQSPAELAAGIADFLTGAGIDESLCPEANADAREFSGYQTEEASKLARAIASIYAAMTMFRSSIREETSPVQLWPHHFDLSMLWLPGGKVPGQDPDNEEHADKQMNFGFTFGDAGTPEPYFYVTAYPEPATLRKTSLPDGASWHSEGFSGVLVPYRVLERVSEPQEYLMELWNTLLAAGRPHMLTNSEPGEHR